MTTAKATANRLQSPRPVGRWKFRSPAHCEALMPIELLPPLIGLAFLAVCTAVAGILVFVRREGH